ncbi:MAG TPA: hypothetical protein VIZ63_06845 [Povalibacter sp.]
MSESAWSKTCGTALLQTKACCRLRLSSEPSWIVDWTHTNPTETQVVLLKT